MLLVSLPAALFSTAVTNSRPDKLMATLSLFLCVSLFLLPNLHHHHQPRSSVPRGMVACVGTLFVTCFTTLFACASSPPGIEAVTAALLPLNFGYSKMFRASESLMGYLSIPATWATAFGFIYCYGKTIDHRIPLASNNQQPQGSSGNNNRLFYLR